MFTYRVAGPDISISQGSVAKRLACDEVFNYHFLTM